MARQDTPTDKDKYFLEIACEEAAKGVTTKKGGPFGAVVVKNGEIIVRVHNRLLETKDPTAHAEVTAIREAAAKLDTFNLSGCVLYSSCEPCPMCFTACLWARLDKVYYSCTQDDAAEHGFDDALFYSIVTDKAKRDKYATAIPLENATRPMKMWMELEDKCPY